MAYTTPEFVANFQSEIDSLVTSFQTVQQEKQAEADRIPDELEDLDIELKSIRWKATSTFGANNAADAYDPYPNSASPGHIELESNQTVKITNGTVTVTVSGSTVTVTGATTANFGAANITTTGNITGATVTGTTDVVGGGKSLKTHTHDFTDTVDIDGATLFTSGADFSSHSHDFPSNLTADVSGTTQQPN